MKVSKETVVKHRQAILEAAGKLFRGRGFDDVTVAQVMKEAGLTHGAFYGYFSSKEALIAEAVGSALTPAPDKPRAAATAYADSYLSCKHRDNRDTSCMFSSLGTEASRGSRELRHTMTESLRRQIERFTPEAEGASPQEKRRSAIAAWAAMVGAVVLARIADDEKLSEEILSATRDALPFA